MRHQASPVLFLLAILLALPATQALYFYMDRHEQRCFIEELPKETTVVGTYKSEEFNHHTNAYQENPETGIIIGVEVLPNHHRVINQKGGPTGRFAFTTSESGDHAICFSTNSTGWFSSGAKTRIHLDLMFGDAEHDTSSSKKEVLSDMAQRVRDLNTRIQAIRHEQRYQREREAQFRDTSERANSRVVWWIIVQLVVLGITCVWQIRHLKNFFVTKKLV